MGYIDVNGNVVSFGGKDDVTAPSYQQKMYGIGDADRFKSKVLLAIGDSITEDNTSNDNKSWCSWLKTLLGMNVVNDGKSGTGLLKTYMSVPGFCYRADNDYNGIYTSTSPDMVLIMGNGNDASGGSAYYDYSGNTVNLPSPVGGSSLSALPVGSPSDDANALTCYGAARHLLNKLIERYPKAKIGWILSTPRLQDVSRRWGEDLGQMHGHASVMDKYAEAIMYVCEDLGVPVLDLYHNSILRPWIEENANEYFTDKYSTGTVVHPNTKGIKEGMMNPIIEFIYENF